MDIQDIVNQVIEELEKQKKVSSTNDQQENINSHIIVENKREIGVDNPVDYDIIEKARAITPARIGVGRTGTRFKTKEYLYFRIDHAAAQDAVFNGVSEEFLKEMNLPVLHSKSKSMDEYLMNLDSGRFLNDTSRDWAKKIYQKTNKSKLSYRMA